MAGCGSQGDYPELGRVRGIVTLDGKPLSGARIAFRPQAGGRVASGVADESGRYDLVYLENPRLVLGTRVGENLVYVSTYISEEESDEPRPELVPKCYRQTDTVLRVKVEAGDNEIELPLTKTCGR